MRKSKRFYSLLFTVCMLVSILHPVGNASASTSWPETLYTTAPNATEISEMSYIGLESVVPGDEDSQIETQAEITDTRLFEDFEAETLQKIVSWPGTNHILTDEKLGDNTGKYGMIGPVSGTTTDEMYFYKVYSGTVEFDRDIYLNGESGVALEIRDSSKKVAVYIGLAMNEINCKDGTNDAYLIEKPPVGEWFNLKTVLFFNASTRFYRVYLNGKLLHTQEGKTDFAFFDSTAQNVHGTRTKIWVNGMICYDNIQICNNIEKTYVTGVSLDRSSLSLEIGGSDSLIPNIVPGDATEKNVLWYSSNPMAVAVEPDGTIRAVGPGVSDIKAVTVDGQLEASCRVTTTGYEELTSQTVCTENRTFDDFDDKPSGTSFSNPDTWGTSTFDWRAGSKAGSSTEAMTVRDLSGAIGHNTTNVLKVSDLSEGSSVQYIDGYLKKPQGGTVELSVDCYIPTNDTPLNLSVFSDNSSGKLQSGFISANGGVLRLSDSTKLSGSYVPGEWTNLKMVFYFDAPVPFYRIYLNGTQLCTDGMKNGDFTFAQAATNFGRIKIGTNKSKSFYLDNIEIKNNVDRTFIKQATFVNDIAGDKTVPVEMPTEGILTAKSLVRNEGKKEIKLVVILALYDQKGSMITASIEPYSVGINQSVECVADIDIDNLDEELYDRLYTAKAFVINGIDYLQSLAFPSALQ